MSSTKYDKLQLDGVEYKTTFTKKMDEPETLDRTQSEPD